MRNNIEQMIINLCYTVAHYLEDKQELRMIDAIIKADDEWKRNHDDYVAHVSGHRVWKGK